MSGGKSHAGACKIELAEWVGVGGLWAAVGKVSRETMGPGWGWPLLSLSNNVMQNLPLPNILRSKGQHATAKSIHCQSAQRGGISAGPSGTCPALLSLPTSASGGGWAQPPEFLQLAGTEPVPIPPQQLHSWGPLLRGLFVY
ncbi:hypothetical protein KIL84_008172 [Mauremys mutica]|uniref:Uncharacterized protein n=1 Tax=Mauremys mutica TaxID=74926 RepID=A0A9D3X9F6_9SAUR|nr:hypothetical protein KIL84_008172 [Mauremys mutica]